MAVQQSSAPPATTRSGTLLYKWVPAAIFRKGEALKTPSGQRAVAWGGKVPANRDGWMWDLTIQGDHDFYVDTTVAAVLVHNCTISIDGESGKVRQRWCPIYEQVSR